jgi:steroid delta-isomerase-like uncharacterized protein
MEGDSMSDDIKRNVRRFYDEVINKGNVEVIDELLAPDFVERQEFPGIPPTRDGVKQFFGMWRQAFPDTVGEIELIVAEGDLVGVYATWRGTHQGEFMGMQATGKPFEVPCSDFARFRDGLCVEHWGVFDSGMMMQQLGAIPAMAGSATG